MPEEFDAALTPGFADEEGGTETGSGEELEDAEEYFVGEGAGGDLEGRKEGEGGGDLVGGGVGPRGHGGLRGGLGRDEGGVEMEVEMGIGRVVSQFEVALVR